MSWLLLRLVISMHGLNMKILAELTRYFTHSLTHSLTPCSIVLLEKLTGFQLVKKFPTFYGTRRFITAFTSPATSPYPEPSRFSP